MLLYFLAGLSLLLMLLLSLAIASIRGKADEIKYLEDASDQWADANSNKFDQLMENAGVIGRLEAEIAALKSSADVLKDQLAQGEDTIKFWRGRFDETTVELDKRSMAFLALKADLKAKLDRLDELNGENASLSYRLDEANSGRLVAEDRCVGFKECRLGFSAMERKLTILKLVLDDETEDLDG